MVTGREGLRPSTLTESSLNYLIVSHQDSDFLLLRLSYHNMSLGRVKLCADVPHLLLLAGMHEDFSLIWGGCTVRLQLLLTQGRDLVPDSVQLTLQVGQLALHSLRDMDRNRRRYRYHCSTVVQLFRLVHDEFMHF